MLIFRRTEQPEVAYSIKKPTTSPSAHHQSIAIYIEQHIHLAPITRPAHTTNQSPFTRRRNACRQNGAGSAWDRHPGHADHDKAQIDHRRPRSLFQNSQAPAHRPRPLFTCHLRARAADPHIASIDRFHVDLVVDQQRV